MLILPTIIHAEKQKIRVVVENASIRLNPDIQGEVIKNPPLGSIFEVERVKKEIPVPKKAIPEPEKEVIAKPVRPTPKVEPRKVSPPRGELAIRGAYTLGYSTNDISYSDTFSGGLLKSATSAGELT